MKVIYHKNFLKDIKKLSGNKVLINLEGKILKLKELDNLDGIPNIKKLIGFLDDYRIRLGDYRLGFRYENGTIILDRFLHRKDIYKKYP